MVGPPLLLLVATLVGSLFTVSGLHVTHYALVHSLIIAVTSVALHSMWKWPAISKEPAASGSLLISLSRSAFTLGSVQRLFVRDAQFVSRTRWSCYIVVRCVLVCLVVLLMWPASRATSDF